MAKFVARIGLYSIYELSEKECKENSRVYPTLVCWQSDHHEEIGDMSLTENESETIAEMAEWCQEYSR